MSLPTVTVTGTIYDQTGTPISGAIVTTTLSGLDVYSGEYVFPVSSQVTADSSGNVTLTLFPNALGENNTFYNISATDTDGNQYISTTMVVPNSDTTLGAILNTQPATPYNSGLVGVQVIPFLNQLGTLWSYIKNFNTASRTYTFPDASGTVAVLTGVLTAGAVLFASSSAFAEDPSYFSYDSTTHTLTIDNATVTKINKLTLTAPATGSTLTIADGKTLTASNTLTLAGVDGKTLTVDNSLTIAGTDGSTLTIGAGGTLASMAYQGAGAVAITGGSVDGTTIGANTAATIHATTVNASGDITIGGDLTVNGTATYLNSTNVSLTDSLVMYASGNVADITDIGFYGQYEPSSTPLYAGLFRDATDGIFKLFKDTTVQPTTTVNTAGSGYAVATLLANLQSSSVSITGGSIDGTAIGVNTPADGHFAALSASGNITSYGNVNVSDYGP